MYLFDTNVLSELVRPRPNATVVRRMLSLDPALRYASEVSRFELRLGARMRNDEGALWNKIEQRILPEARWLPIDGAVAIAAADLGHGLRRKGQPAEWPELLLAATALVSDLTMVTRNVRHFERMVGLTVENWFEDE